MGANEPQSRQRPTRAERSAVQNEIRDRARLGLLPKKQLGDRLALARNARTRRDLSAALDRSADPTRSQAEAPGGRPWWVAVLAFVLAAALGTLIAFLLSGESQAAVSEAGRTALGPVLCGHA